MATEEITISELELADEVLADMTLPVDTATETRAVTLKQLRAWLGSALPIGSIFASIGRLDDERFTLLDGKTISRTGTYQAFCDKVVEKVQAGTWKACAEEEFNLEVSETGQCGKFVVSNDYVRIPKLGNSLYSDVIDGKIPVVGNGMALGVTDGTRYGGMSIGSTSTGLFGVTSAYGLNIGSNNTSGDMVRNVTAGITTDPKKSGIEGKLETNPVKVFYYMVISTEGQTANVEIDINKVYEDLNLKANSDLSNVASVASSFKEASVGWGMADYSAGISKTWNRNITAENYGVVIANARADQQTTLKAIVNGNQLPYDVIANAGVLSISFTVSKGDVYKVYDANGTGTIIFYPFKGVN